MPGLLDARLGDEALLARYRGGDAEAFDILYQRHARNLHAFALGLTRDADAARDVVQESFVRLLERAEPQRVGVFLYTVARNLIRDEGRRRSVRRGTFDVLGRLFSRRARARTANERLPDELEALPPESREIVLLKVFGGFTFAEIGDLLGIPLSTAATRYQAAVETLDRLWRDA